MLEKLSDTSSKTPRSGALTASFEVWLRIDTTTRMRWRPSLIMHLTLELAHTWVAKHWPGRAYEIDYEGKTVFVSVKSEAILNGDQYGLFNMTRQME